MSDLCLNLILLRNFSFRHHNLILFLFSLVSTYTLRKFYSCRWRVEFRRTQNHVTKKWITVAQGGDSGAQRVNLGWYMGFSVMVFLQVYIASLSVKLSLRRGYSNQPSSSSPAMDSSHSSLEQGKSRLKTSHICTSSFLYISWNLLIPILKVQNKRSPICSLC